jgi:type II secretory pathway pseudopilin PulG
LLFRVSPSLAARLQRRPAMRITGSASGEHGFTLIEAVIATGLLAATLAALAGLLIVAIDANASARRTGTAVVLVSSKIDSLRRMVLAVSPPESLWENRTGYCEALARDGTVLGDCSALDDAAFVRRWSVATGAAAGTVAVSVAVAWRNAMAASAPEGRIDEVRLATLVLANWP